MINANEVTPQIIADFILRYTKDRGEEVSNLKLQKLVYYAQAWYLAIKDKPLFPDDFEAWIHGPVIRKLYNRYRKYGWKPIPVPDDLRYPELKKPLKSFLEEVVNVYGRYEGWELERLVHTEAPWNNARKGVADTEPSTNIIPKEDMKVYYRKVMVDAEKA